MNDDNNYFCTHDKEFIDIRAYENRGERIKCLLARLKHKSELLIRAYRKIESLKAKLKECNLTEPQFHVGQVVEYSCLNTTETIIFRILSKRCTVDTVATWFYYNGPNYTGFSAPEDRLHTLSVEDI